MTTVHQINCFGFGRKFGCSAGILELRRLLTLLPKEARPYDVGPWLCGGSIRRALKGQDQDADLDLFLSGEQTADDIDQAFKATEYWHLKTSKPHADLWEFRHPALPLVQVQVVKFRSFSSPHTLLSNVDFTHCQFVYDGSDIYYTDEAVEDSRNNRLRVVTGKLHSATGVVRRLMKYAAQGYDMPNNELRDILKWIADNPMSLHAADLYGDGAVEQIDDHYEPMTLEDYDKIPPAAEVL